MIGATILVLLVVIGFPVLFDTQPRPVKGDIQIEIADKDKVKPADTPVAIKTSGSKGPSGATNTASADGANSRSAEAEKEVAPSEKSKDQMSLLQSTGVAAGVAVAGAAVSAVTRSSSDSNNSGAASASAKSLAPESKEPKEVIISTKAPQSKVAAAVSSGTGSAGGLVVNSSRDAKEGSREASKDGSKETSKETSKESTKEAVRENSKDTKDTKDLKDPKDAKDSKDPKDAKPVKQMVQVGIFTDQAKVKEYSTKLEKAGYKVAVHSVPGKDGSKRIRIRVGPYKSKDDALHVVDKLKEMKIPGAQFNLIPLP